MVVDINKDVVEWGLCGLNGRKDKLIYNTMVLPIRMNLVKLNNTFPSVMDFNIFMENQRRMLIWV
jgi:hypothetical protein